MTKPKSRTSAPSEPTPQVESFSLSASSKQVALVDIRGRVLEMYSALTGVSHVAVSHEIGITRRLAVAGFALRLVLAYLDGEIERERSNSERWAKVQIGVMAPGKAGAG